MYKVLIVEPHPDDFLLSAWSIYKSLKSDDYKFGLMSLSTRKNGGSEKLCAYAGIDHVSVVATEDIDNKTHRIKPHVIKKQPMPYEYQYEEYTRRFPSELADCIRIIKDGIFQYQPDILMTGLGILHPFHVICGKAVMELHLDSHLPQTQLFLWCDFPYANRQYGKMIIKNALLSDFYILDSIEPIREDVDEKIVLFHKFYPTENIYYDEPGLYKNSEILILTGEE